VKCTIFNGLKALGNFGYAVFRQDLLSIASSGIDIASIGNSCIKKIHSKQTKNPFTIDISNVKFDSAHMRRLNYGKYKDSPLHQKHRKKFIKNLNRIINSY
jgi:hypothetical protein